jgi:predicted RNA-binding Zn-ribbon protein involved in translation (DUF1610 family)
MTHESGREEIERRKMVTDASSYRELVARARETAFGTRPCPVCGRMFSVLKVALQPHTCRYCGSELLLPNDTYQKEQ